MPITIKSTELKYKNPSTGQYQGIDAVAERTTSEQCALIEAKGAETIASIPSDYTTLSDTVDDLTSDVSDLNGAINAITPLDTTPTANSTKGVTSGGTYSGIKAVDDKLTTLNSYKATSGVVNSMPLYGFAKQVNSSLLRGYYFMPWYTDGNYNITISSVTLEGIGSITTGISVFTKGYYVVIVDTARNGTAGECFLSRIACNISY